MVHEFVGGLVARWVVSVASSGMRVSLMKSPQKAATHKRIKEFSTANRKMVVRWVARCASLERYTKLWDVAFGR
jgi:hypothetical protein